jgi:hypothetical protein
MPKQILWVMLLNCHQNPHMPHQSAKVHEMTDKYHSLHHVVQYSATLIFKRKKKSFETLIFLTKYQNHTFFLHIYIYNLCQHLPELHIVQNVALLKQGLDSHQNQQCR